MDPYIVHRLNFVQNLKTPSAVFISTEKNLEEGIREVKAYNIDKILTITNLLRQAGMDAVPCFLPEATDPSKIAVTAGGIQTPVLSPKEAKKTTEQIFDVLHNQLIQKHTSPYYLGTALPVEISQMADISQTSQRYMRGKSIDPDLYNQDATQIREKFGFHLEEDLYFEALNSPKIIPAEQLYQSNKKGLKSLYRGGTLGNMPYISLASRESKNLAYSTPDIKTALMYSGVEGSAYGSKIKCFTQTGESFSFGFLYEFDVDKKSVLFRDWGIERGDTPYLQKKSDEICEDEWIQKNLETPVFPSKNKLKQIYLHVRKEKQDYLYPIDTTNPKWQAMLALYTPADTSKRGYMIDRRQQILKKRKVYNTAKAKILGIFTKKLKPIEITSSVEDLIAAANITIERKKQQQKNKQEKKLQISRLRGISSTQKIKLITTEERKKQFTLPYAAKIGTVLKKYTIR